MGHFLPFYQPNSLKNQSEKKKKKKKKKPWRYHHFRYVCQKVWSDDDGLMDRWKKWHIEVGAPPKNMNVLKTLRMPDLIKPSPWQAIKNLVLVKALKRKLLKVLVFANALKRKYKCTRKILKLHSPEKLWKEKLLKTLIIL